MSPIPSNPVLTPENDAAPTGGGQEGNGAHEGPNALEELIAEVARMQELRVEELHTYRDWLSSELVLVDGEMAELNEGEGAGEGTLPPNGHAKGAVGPAKAISLKKLVSELEAAPERTLNIRKAKLDVKHIKTLVRENPHLLQAGGKGSWPTVTLLEQPEPEAEDPAQGMFAFD